MQEAMRRGQIPATFPSFGPTFPPMSPLEPYQTKSVLQNDFLTAKQMSACSANIPTAPSAYTTALDKDKSGKASPLPKDPLVTAGKYWLVRIVNDIG